MQFIDYVYGIAAGYTALALMIARLLYVHRRKEDEFTAGTGDFHASRDHRPRSRRTSLP